MKKLFLLLLLLICPALYGQDVRTYIPTKAYALLPIVKAESLRLMPDMHSPWYFGALMEHESCISLKHSRCMSPTSELLTKREQGVGISMITRAWNTDGTLRFDSLNDLRRRNMAELRELSWSNVKQRPDLQVRTLILLTKGNYDSLYTIKDQEARLDMADAAYNGGPSGLRKEILTCSLAANCNPQYWFGNVEKYCMKSKKPLYAGRSACDINRHHVSDVRHTRQDKYKLAFSKL